jgi:FAD/FMN-containing dehydrogenase
MTAPIAALRDLLGADNVSDDPAECALAASDLFPDPDTVPVDLVIRPGDTGETARAMRLLAEAGCAVVPRGAGLSYTGGVTPHAPAVAVDTARMTAITVDAGNLCAVVGAGATWQSVMEALAPLGLRAAQASPISGSVATVGGTAAQNLPGSMDGFLGVAAVLADGTPVRTGALALADAPAFWRNVGPDLTGLFLGDCGAFGVKTELAIRLAPVRAAAFASFGFEHGPEMMGGLVEVVRGGLVVRALAMDQVRAKGASRVEAGDALRTAGAVIAQAGGVWKAVRDVAQLAHSGSQLSAPAWSLHLTAEGVTEPAAEAAIAAARALVLARGGREIAPAVPKALRARPYSIRGFVGPDGERWVPVHGMLPLAAAQDCLRALGERIETLRPGLEKAGVSVSHIVSSLGAYVTIEPMFYWPDALDPLHMRHLSDRNRARFGSAPVNAPAREAVRDARAAMVAVLDAHGAVHAQIGRHYALLPRMGDGAASLLRRVKAALDPSGRMNPGALGLGETPCG